jgi:hypothetical protein
MISIRTAGTIRFSSSSRDGQAVAIDTRRALCFSPASRRPRCLGRKISLPRSPQQRESDIRADRAAFDMTRQCVVSTLNGDGLVNGVSLHLFRGDACSRGIQGFFMIAACALMCLFEFSSFRAKHSPS